MEGREGRSGWWRYEKGVRMDGGCVVGMMGVGGEGNWGIRGERMGLRKCRGKGMRVLEGVNKG